MARYKSASQVDLSEHVVLGSYSTDEKGHYCDNDSNRRFFVQPDDEPNFDLNDGLDEFIDVPEHGWEPKSMDPILMWMRDHREELEEKNVLQKIRGTPQRRLDVAFIGRRGVFGNLLRSALVPQKQEFFVTLYRGTYYIEKFGESGHFDDCTYYSFSGHKFRQLVTSVDGYQPDTFLPVNANEAYYAVMTATLGGERILFSSDIQGERQESPELPPRNYVAIKTKKSGSDLGRYKALQWWSQCYLTGIPEIVCGNRDDRRKVIRDVERYKTDDLPSLFENYGWKRKSCLNKLKDLLVNIREMVSDDDPRSVYHLVLDEVEKGPGQLKRLEARKFRVKGKKDDDYVILKDWYLKDVLGGE